MSDPTRLPNSIDIVFDAPPGPQSGRIIEVENAEGRSIKIGEWVHRPDGYWALRISLPSEARQAELERYKADQAEGIKVENRLHARIGDLEETNQRLREENLRINEIRNAQNEQLARLVEDQDKLLALAARIRTCIKETQQDGLTPFVNLTIELADRMLKGGTVLGRRLATLEELLELAAITIRAVLGPEESARIAGSLLARIDGMLPVRRIEET